MKRVSEGLKEEIPKKRWKEAVTENTHGRRDGW